MRKYSVLIDVDAETFLKKLPEKSNRIVKEALLSLGDDPIPGKGDKELLGKGIYRIHIGRSYTAAYKISVEEKRVIILWLGTIEQAHKLYGRLLE